MQYTPEEVEKIVARISELRAIWAAAATAHDERKNLAGVEVDQVPQADA
jgi:hypothetical protein